MKKKFFAVALATTMALSTTAMAATADFANVNETFAKNSGDETLTGDFNVTYKFHTKSYESEGLAHETFAVEITNAGLGDYVKGTNANFMTAVVGNANQWWFNDAGAATQWAGDFVASYSDADKSKGVLADADVVCTIVRTGEKITVNATATGSAGEATYSLEVTNTAGFGDTINLHLTSEDSSVSGITFTNNAAQDPTNPTDPTNPADPTKATDPTKAPTPTTKAPTAAKTGDVAPVAALAAVAVVACAAVVVSKKKVTE